MFACNRLPVLAVASLVVLFFSHDVEAQFRIGGRNGIVAGGGQGLRIGGYNGVQFGGGQGARFGPAGVGVQFGGGQGARFGPSVQFGGGQGARFGNAVQFGGRNNFVPRGNVGGFNATSPQAIANSGQMVLGLEATAQQPFTYFLNNTRFVMPVGGKTYLQRGQSWTVSFAPAPQQPRKSVPIKEPGIYLFTQQDGTWDLVRQTAEPDAGPTPTREVVATPNSEGVPAADSSTGVLPQGQVPPVASETPIPSKPKPISVLRRPGKSAEDNR